MLCYVTYGWIGVHAVRITGYAEDTENSLRLLCVLCVTFFYVSTQVIL